MIDAVIGIDIGATTTTFGIIDANAEVLKEGVMDTRAQEDVTRFLPRIYQELAGMKDALNGQAEIKGIGIGAPNANFYKGIIAKPANLSWGEETPIVEIFQDKYQVPVFLTNDANAAAVGEMQFGVAQGMRDFMVITLGSGLGSGIVVDGRLVHGHTGYAGEMGHLIVKEGGRQSPFNRRGGLESYVSVTGLRRTVSKLLADSREFSELRNIAYNELTGEMISDAAIQGDRIALEAFEYTGMFLGRALANAALFTSPEAFILFGGLANSKDLIFQPTLKHMEESLMPTFRGTIKLLLSGLQDKNAAVLGTGALAWHQLQESPK